MTRNGLYSALVATPRTPPPTMPRALTVAPLRPLPQNIRFGPMSPPALGGTRFTGAQVTAPLNVVHPQDLPTFQAPTYNPPSAVVRPVSPLVQALQPLVAQALTGAVGRTPTATPPPPTPPPPTGYWNPATTTSTPWDPGVPTQDANSPTSGELRPVRSGGFGSSSSALIAALAQLGQRLGSNRGYATFY